MVTNQKQCGGSFPLSASPVAQMAQDGIESAHDAGDTGSIPGSGRSPGEGNGNPLQYSCLENSMHRGAWRATAHGVAELDMTEPLTLCRAEVVSEPGVGPGRETGIHMYLRPAQCA